MDILLNYGLRFWGNESIFNTPWFHEFNATTMVVSTMLVWVKLPNLPLPFWHPRVIEDIGKKLGKFNKMGNEKIEKGFFTFAKTMCPR